MAVEQELQAASAELQGLQAVAEQHQVLQQRYLHTHTPFYKVPNCSDCNT